MCFKQEMPPVHLPTGKPTEQQFVVLLLLFELEW
jgi:hypothetical protein